jgi:hypothetical protein
MIKNKKVLESGQVVKGPKEFKWERVLARR